MSENRSRARMWRRWGLRAAGSAVILLILFKVLPRDAILTGIQKIPPLTFAYVFFLFICSHFVAAAKWWNLLDRSFSFGLAIRAHFAGLAANLCLPGAAGGDAVRAGVAYTGYRNGPRIAAGSAADRLVDLVALACLSMTGLMALSDAHGSGRPALLALVLVLGLSLIVIYALPMIVRRVWARFPTLPARNVALKTSDALADLGRRPTLLLLTLFLSIAVQISLVAMAYRFALAIGVNVPFAAWVFAWTLAKLIAVLPISLGGLGVREATLAALLVSFGADASQVVAAGLAWQAVLFLAGGLGGIIQTLPEPRAGTPRSVK